MRWVFNGVWMRLFLLRCDKGRRAFERRDLSPVSPGEFWNPLAGLVSKRLEPISRDVSLLQPRNINLEF
jgi:hypothetical protein